MDPTLTDAQLRLMRCLRKDGWSAELLPYLLSRNSATEAEWAALAAAGLVEEASGRWRLTDEGKRAYRRQSAGRYF